MTNFDNDSGINVQPPVPSITPKNGYATSQGQMTGIFTIICLMLSLLGFHYTPEQFNGWVDAANHMATTLVPLITAVAGIIGYTLSRGKTYQSAMLATAHVQAAAMAPPTIMGQATGLLADPLETSVGFAGLGKPKDMLHDLMGGKSWKDPERYEHLLGLAARFGVPGATEADKVNQQLHPVDLVKGILDAVHSGRKQQI